MNSDVVSRPNKALGFASCLISLSTTSSFNNSCSILATGALTSTKGTAYIRIICITIIHVWFYLRLEPYHGFLGLRGTIFQFSSFKLRLSIFDSPFWYCIFWACHRCVYTANIVPLTKTFVIKVAGQCKLYSGPPNKEMLWLCITYMGARYGHGCTGTTHITKVFATLLVPLTKTFVIKVAGQCKLYSGPPNKEMLWLCITYMGARYGHGCTGTTHITKVFATLLVRHAHADTLQV